MGLQTRGELIPVLKFKGRPGKGSTLNGVRNTILLQVYIQRGHGEYTLQYNPTLKAPGPGNRKGRGVDGVGRMGHQLQTL